MKYILIGGPKSGKVYEVSGVVGSFGVEFPFLEEVPSLKLPSAELVMPKTIRYLPQRMHFRTPFAKSAVVFLAHEDLSEEEAQRLLWAVLWERVGITVTWE